MKSPALRRAVVRLLTALDDRELGREFDSDRARARLHFLVACLEGGPAGELESLSPSDLVLCDRLLQGLRKELLSSWSAVTPLPAADDVLALLAGIEKLHERLQPGTAETSFQSLLSSLRGPELVVELAHDLRSPLTSILFLAETLRNGNSGPMNDLQHRQMGIIYSAALSLISMAGNVIELVRDERSLLEKEPAPFSVSHAFDSVYNLVRPMIEEKEIIVRKVTPEEDHRLGFPLALSRVLLNLTTNAIKFTENGFVEIVATETGDGRVEFSVRDSGPGIDPEAVDQLFEPFRSLPTRDRIGLSGTGLGLSICRRLVSAMGGQLQYESEPRWGTRFFFSLHVPPVPRS